MWFWLLLLVIILTGNSSAADDDEVMSQGPAANNGSLIDHQVHAAPAVSGHLFLLCNLVMEAGIYA